MALPTAPSNPIHRARGGISDDGDDDDDDDDDDADPFKLGYSGLCPWAKKCVDYVNDREAGNRKILWPYSTVGRACKTLTAQFIVSNYGALVVDPTSPKHVKQAISKKWNLAEEQLEKLDDRQRVSHARFKANPVIIIDIPRAASNPEDMSSILKKPAFYTTLEEIQSNFCSPMYETAQVNWGDGTVVKIIIFANYAPEVDKVSTDRLQVSSCRVMILRALATSPSGACG